MDTPFKFLDAYDKEDKDRFFGRTRETARLYNAVHASNIVLLYGASGTGKTSLVNCGLANKFYETDWLPIFIRRGNDLMTSISKELQRVADSNELSGDASLTEMVENIYKNFYRPVYLIFDQFEEIFVLGKLSEQKAFNQAIAALLKSGLPCKVLISIREEYIAYLSEFEKLVPSLFDNRLRIEKMNDNNLYRVVSGTAKNIGIRIDQPRETVPAIIENIRNPREGVELAHLQIYMDKLYRNDQKRIASEHENREIRFDPALVGGTKQLEGVISDFVDEQLKVIDRELEAKGITERQVALEILFALVTDDGTKRNRKSKIIEERLMNRKGISAEITQYCIRRFHELKLIRILPD